MTRLRKVAKLVLMVCLVCLLIYLGFVIYFDATFFDRFKTLDLQKELVDNYNKHQNDIQEVKKYFNSIVPKGKTVSVEFENDKELSRFEVSTVDTASLRANSSYFLDWNLKVTSDKVDSVIVTLGWTQRTLQTIKRKLDKAHCIQVENGEPTQIGFQRSGLGMYFYNLFDQPVPDSLKQEYNDSCRYILYNDKLALEFGGGAVGPQCFSRN